jgi:hypothetical protein
MFMPKEKPINNLKKVSKNKSKVKRKVDEIEKSEKKEILDKRHKRHFVDSLKLRALN